LNEINATLDHLHSFVRDGVIVALSSVPASPFVAEHVTRGVAEFCEIADGMDGLLQTEFGGQTTFADSMPSALKH
jgi:hypothetical protein